MEGITFNIWTGLGLLLVIGGFIVLVIFGMNACVQRCGFGGAICGGIMIALGLFVSFFMGRNDPIVTLGQNMAEQAQEEAFEFEMAWNNAIKDEYSFYYNGDEIDPATVDYTLYDVVINNEEKKVFMTDRQPEVHVDNHHDTTYIPVIIPG